MRISVIGTGYVGLVSGTCFAEFGVHVTCVDKDQTKIEALKRGIIPIYEPGLEQLVTDNVKAGRLEFSTDLKASVKEADIVFIAVGTPTRRGGGHADLSYVFAAAEEIGQSLEGYTIIATKSTVPVGTGRKVEEILKKTNPKAEFDVVSNPEFLREGSAIEDFMRPDRVVIGCSSARAEELMRQLYRPLYLIETPLVMTSLETAELTKYASNAFLATKIAFINEIADLCEKTGADVQAVAKGMGLDKRIGGKFLHAGPGYGGSCFPKDTLALAQTANDYGSPLIIVDTVVSSNDKRKKQMVNKIIAACGGTVQGKSIAVLGVTFKPNTDDMRESPSLDIIPGLQKQGAEVRAYDPKGMEEAKELLPNVMWFEDPYAPMKKAEAVVILTEWNEFRALDLDRMKNELKTPMVIDLRNIYKADEMAQAGLDYVSIGRTPVYKTKEGLRAVI
ncbi:UDP-glucose dehydrogenase family protein [Candidatus Nucleicultrix amoebiphila]|jgi:UDPglucose 6-dehydrogenase|uniref:UDP-glucose 6-dehydrogenase n=1 Tax=Candidatus Nucleicultrix amoebiphila FS5 TaxID=1414854 RepID=A0A1W6N6Q6_9PROT|nr:UDP-glucose/GDP-mannose dehydrogenase family protein [Candidatus Nucleicultrix amoebiphila]ARN85436.1 UDP-glucose 6-dehydrogenase [Candidatus Nucleicultrix amoebiphila FS5]